MTNIFTKIKEHGLHVANHLHKHKHHYALGIFGSFAVVKTILLIGGFFGSLSIVTTHANIDDPITTCAGVTEISETECQALVALYNSTNGNEWKQSDNWGDIKNIANRYGVTIENNHVTKLTLGENNLAGELPSEIGNLSELEWLDMYDNKITTLPGEIGNLKKLQYLYLYDNALIDLPREIGYLGKLQGLYINGNQLTSLPKEIGNLKSLQWLDISKNKISSIPETIEKIFSLEYFNINHNTLETSLLTPSAISFIEKNATDKNWKILQCSAIRDCSSNYYTTMCGPCDASHQSAAASGSIKNSPYSKEFNDAYLRAYDNAITTMPTVQKADLGSKIIRKHFAKMIAEFAIKVLHKEPNTEFGCDFMDTVDEPEEMNYYIKTACQLGLMGREGDGVTLKDTFDGNTSVTRAQFGTILSRLLYGTAYNNTQTSVWYSKHLSNLKNQGIMDSISQPTKDEIRGDILITLMKAALKNK